MDFIHYGFVLWSRKTKQQKWKYKPETKTGKAFQYVKKNMKRK